MRNYVRQMSNWDRPAKSIDPSGYTKHRTTFADMTRLGT